MIKFGAVEDDEGWLFATSRACRSSSTSGVMCGTAIPCGCGGRPDSPWLPCCRWRSASAPTPRFQRGQCRALPPAAVRRSGPAGRDSRQTAPERESQRLPPLSAMIEWQEQARSFEQIEGIVWCAEANTLSGGDAAERVSVQFLTPGAFSLLGVKPAGGRGFIPEDAVTASRSVIIGDGLWQRRFGGDPACSGQAIRVGDTRGQSWACCRLAPGPCPGCKRRHLGTVDCGGTS